MLDLLLKVLGYTLIPVVAVLIGAFITAIRPPSPAVRSFVQHFAAGVVFAAAAGEILPDLVHEKSLPAVIIGGAIGVAAMLSLKYLGEKAESSNSLTTTIAIDVLIDGLLIGVGFAAEAKAGILLTIALTIELLFLSLSISASLSQANASWQKVMRTTLGIALLLPFGAVIGVTLLSHLPAVILAGFLAFGLIALLYLVTEELLVEAHEIPDTPLTTGVFFGGFLLLIVIEELLR
ncbi:MAG: transporter [Leptolyngbyaceae cyanobacterium bins.302]|nr:transporter [Leptolyngbyaceae cyanobacterium bins.302]